MMSSYFSEKLTDIGFNSDNRLANLLIFFGELAPDELKDYCLILSKHRLDNDIHVADYFFIDNQKYKITSVGSKASNQLREIGHLTVYFDGSREVGQSGAISVEKSDYPVFTKDSVIEFKRL